MDLILFIAFLGIFCGRTSNTDLYLNHNRSKNTVQFQRIKLISPTNLTIRNNDYIKRDYFFILERNIDQEPIEVPYKFDIDKSEPLCSLDRDQVIKIICTMFWLLVIMSLVE